MRTYGAAPEMIGDFQHVDLDEVMYYLYLPVMMPGRICRGPRLPPNIEQLRSMVISAVMWARAAGRDVRKDYVYVSARKGWATRDSPLNRPGWHADGFGTDDLNFVWWRGPGTRFALGDFGEVPASHTESLRHFEYLLEEPRNWKVLRQGHKIVDDLPEAHLYALTPYVVHATPIIVTPCWRQYVKISLSRHQYNLENNSHNYFFDYDWPLSSREEVRNDTFKVQRDYP